MAERNADGEVRAAGGAVWRRAADGAVEVLVVHRPRYDDLTLPKGKCEVGESDEATAAREVAEETGLTCALGADLGEVRYVDHRGRPKVVRYWAMTVLGGTFAPNDEVDAASWLPAPVAAAALTHPHDAVVLDRLLHAT